MSGLRSVLLWMLAGTCCCAWTQKPVSEYRLKAQILIQILPYVQWPKEEAEPGRAFNLVVLGKSPFGDDLDDQARSRTVGKRPIRIRYVTRMVDVGPCEAVFICQSESSMVGKIANWARANKILTIGDDSAFLDKGIMMNLILENEARKRSSVKLAVNMEEAKAGGFLISSRLLAFATIINMSPTPDLPVPRNQP